MSYDATNNLNDLDETKPAGSEDAAQADEIFRETRRVFKTLLLLFLNPDGTFKDDVINTTQVLNDAVTALKLNDNVAGAGLRRNATTKALELLFDSDLFVIDGNNALSLKSGIDLSDFVTGLQDAAIASVGVSKLTHAASAGRVLLTNGVGGVEPVQLSGAVSVSPSGVVTLNTGIANVIVFETTGSGTGAGGLTAATWVDRASLVKQLDTNNLAVVSGDTITLQPGFTYLFDIQVPAFGVDGHIARLWDDTGGTIVASGTSSFTGKAADSNEQVDYSEIFAAVAVETNSRSFKVQSNCQTTNADSKAKGHPASVASVAEVYTRVLIYVLQSTNAA